MPNGGQCTRVYTTGRDFACSIRYKGGRAYSKLSTRCSPAYRHLLRLIHRRLSPWLSGRRAGRGAFAHGLWFWAFAYAYGHISGNPHQPVG